jgi:hypothetical protein
MLSIKNGKEKLLKIVLIFNFSLLIAALDIIVRTGPAVSYEFSIYDAYPWYFWLLILTAVFCGQLVILGSAIAQSRKNYWIFGLCAILVANTLILCLSVIRGYMYVSDGDILTHVGSMMDILQTSSIGKNFYPIDHILGVILHLFSGLSLPFLTEIIPLFFALFFIFSMYFVGKIFFFNRFHQKILIILSSIFIFGTYFVGFFPNGQAFALVPLILYAALKMDREADNKKYYILLLLICFLIVFFHPLVTVIVILILCLMQGIRYVLAKYEKNTLTSVNYIYTIFFMAIVFIMWSSYLSLVAYTVTPIVERLAGNEIDQTQVQQNIAVVSQINIDPIYLLKLGFNIYGQQIIIGLFSILCTLLILKSLKNETMKADLYLMIPFFGFIIFLIFSVIMLFTNGSFGFGRIYIFVMLFSIFIIPTGVYLIWSNNSNDRWLTLIRIIKISTVIFFIFSISYFSIFNLYPSPIVKQAGIEVLKSEYQGMSTFLIYRDVALPVLEYLPSSFRYHDAIYGEAAEKVNLGRYDPHSFPLDHFGYQNENLSLRVFYDKTRYLLIDERGRGFYKNVYPEFSNMWRFLPKDFERLKFNERIQKVYSNRNLEVFIVSKI